MSTDYERALQSVPQSQVSEIPSLSHLAQIRQIFISTPVPPDLFEIKSKSDPSIAKPSRTAQDVFAELKALRGAPETIEVVRQSVVNSYVPVSYNDYVGLGLYSRELPTEFEEEPEGGEE
jgi:hypothetical protein